jgi:hypothetical protein
MAEETDLHEIGSSLRFDFDGRESTEVNLGTIPVGSETIVDLEWHNKTSNVLTVLRASGSCSCLVGHLDKQVVGPGECMSLKIRARPAQHIRALRQQLEIAIIEGNSTQESLKRLQVVAQVLPFFRVEPGHIDVSKGKSEEAILKVYANFRAYSVSGVKLSSIASKLELVGAQSSPEEESRAFTVRIHPDSTPNNSSEVLNLAFFDDSKGEQTLMFSSPLELRFRDFAVFRPSRIPLYLENDRFVGMVLLLCEPHWKEDDAFEIKLVNQVIGEGRVVRVEGRKSTLRLEVENAKQILQFTPISFELPSVGLLSIDARCESE